MDLPEGRVISGPRSTQKYNFSAADLRRDLIQQCGAMSKIEQLIETTTLEERLARLREESVERNKKDEAAREQRIREEEAREAIRIKEDEERERKHKIEQQGREEKYQQYLESISVLSNKNCARLKGLSKKVITDIAAAKAWDTGFWQMCKQLHLSDRVIRYNRCNHRYLLPRGSPHIEEWKKTARERVVRRYAGGTYMEREYGADWQNSERIRNEIRIEQNSEIRDTGACRLCAKFITLKKAPWHFEYTGSDDAALDNIKWIIDHTLDQSDYYADSDSDNDDEPEEGKDIPMMPAQETCFRYRTEMGLECLRALYSFIYKEPNILSSVEFHRLSIAIAPKEEHENIMRYRQHMSRSGDRREHPVYLPPDLAARIRK